MGVRSVLYSLSPDVVVLRLAAFLNTSALLV